MSERFVRTEMLLGAKAIKRLAESRIAVFGVGGVGGYAAEALARSGVGAIDLIDNDIISESNINRQIIALNSTIGLYKVDAARDRILDINPECSVATHKVFFLPENSGDFDFKAYDYIIDAVDTVTAKLEIIKKATESGIPVISSMGAGNKTDPTLFRVGDVFETTGCPLARVMRRELRKCGINTLKTVYSTQEPKIPIGTAEAPTGRRSVPGSVAFVPSVAGLIAAGEVIKELTAGCE